MHFIMQKSATKLLSDAGATWLKPFQTSKILSSPVILLSRRTTTRSITCSGGTNSQQTSKSLLNSIKGQSVARRQMNTFTHLVKFQVRQPRKEMFVQIIRNFMSTISNGLPANSNGGSRDEHIVELLSNSQKTNKEVKIVACGQLYAELSKTNPVLYGGAPENGIKFNVQYYDSFELLEETSKVSANLPTVCLLHGAPGHFQDFASLINYLTKKQVRVIAPNFPDYSVTFEHSFRHSPRERLDFLLQFFRAIKIYQLDMIAGHSSAVYTIFELLNYCKQKVDKNDNRLDIKSVGLFSTPSHVLPHNLAPTPLRLFTLKLFDYPILRPFVMALIQTFVKFQGIRNRVDKNKIENLLIAASAMGYSEHGKMKSRLGLLSKYEIPTILVYGTRDRLITCNNFKELEKDLGISNDNQVKRYKSDGSLEFDVSERNKLVDVSRFESGGHYTFQKYSSQVNEDIYNFLNSRVVDRLQSGQQEDREATKL